MAAAEWSDRGRVLSSARLSVGNGDSPKELRVVLVAVTDGPKLVCFSQDDLSVGEEAIISVENGKCSARRERFGPDPVRT
jgi:hypothetical protein